MDARPATAPPPPSVPPRRTGRRAAMVALGVLAVLVALVVALVAALAWALRTESGTAWLLTRVPGVEASRTRGALLGDFQAERLALRFGGTSVGLTGLAWSAPRIGRSEAPAAWLRIAFDRIVIDRVDLAFEPDGSDAPAQPPTDLSLPVELEIGALEVGALHTAALGEQPVRDLRAAVHLGADGGALHRIDRFSAARGDLRASGNARIATGGGLPVAASVEVAQAASATLPAWQAQAEIAGPLSEPIVRAAVEVAAAPPATRAQSASLVATLRPFAAFPLADLQARTQDLDLSALVAGAPATSLSGTAQARATAADQPADIAVDVTNAAAGTWDAGAVPVRRLRLQAQGTPAAPDTLTIQSLEVDLGTTAAAAGRITGSGQWAPPEWNLQVRLTGLEPARLDARAPAMRLEGTIAAAGSGFAAGAERRVGVEAALNGRLADGPRQPVALRLDGAWTASADGSMQRIELRDARAEQGRGRATASGSAARERADAPWRIAGKLDLAEFDPRAWWAGPRGARPSTGDRINAAADVDLAWSAAAAPADIAGWIAALTGRADVRVTDSRVAGVPLAGTAGLASDTRIGTVALQIEAAGNSVEAEGRVSAASGRADRWSGTIAAPALERLQAIGNWLDPGNAAAIAGAVRGRFAVEGRWPALATSGELSAQGLRAGPAAARTADVRWRLGTAGDAPVEIEARAEQLRIASIEAAPPVLALTLRTSGTARAHRLELDAEVDARPPTWVDTVQGLDPAAQDRTRVALQARGGFRYEARASDPLSPTGWQGTLAELLVRRSVARSEPLLQARNVTFDARWAGGPPRVAVEPGSAEILGSDLRWSRVTWEAGNAGAPARLDAEATLEPTAIAPILARLQPDLGWGGDLRIGARMAVRSGPGFRADVVVERSSGDLTLGTTAGRQALGLSSLRVALDAREGVWQGRMAVAGKLLGLASANVTVRTAADARWPSVDAPIEGLLRVRLDDVSVLSAWVPVGWRIGGALEATATIDGTFGAPEYRGSLRGDRLQARNFLEGVQVTDGELQVALQGTTARIERFVARAGEGTLRVTGGAELGAAPTANLTLVAERLQVLGRIDRRVVVSGRAQARLDAETIAVDGRFTVDEGLIDASASEAPKLSDDVVVIRSERDLQSQPARRAAGPQRKVSLDVRVDLGRNLEVRGYGLYTRLAGALDITAPGGELAVHGAVRTVSGRYAAYGQELDIQRGVVMFSGRIENPRLDVRAVRPGLEVTVGVAVTGTVQSPRVRLFSEPEMSDMDKLSWLTMGRPSAGLASDQAALLQRAALALWAGDEGGGENRIAKMFGLTDIGVSAGEGGLADAVVTLGKQLSERWYVGYEQSIQGTGGSWQLIYRVAQRFTLRAQTGAASAIDAIWTWRWD